MIAAKTGDNPCPHHLCGSRDKEEACEITLQLENNTAGEIRGSTIRAVGTTDSGKQVNINYISSNRGQIAQPGYLFNYDKIASGKKHPSATKDNASGYIGEGSCEKLKEVVLTIEHMDRFVENEFSKESFFLESKVPNLLLTLDFSTFDSAIKEIAAAREKTQKAKESKLQEEIKAHGPISDTLAAAEKGDAARQSYVGYYYSHGLGVPQDKAKAAYWYEKSAAQGNVIAQLRAGEIYSSRFHHEGVPDDDSRSMTWYKKAAEQGNEAAMLAVGHMYLDGRGVPKDAAAGSQWIRKVTDMYSNLVACVAPTSPGLASQLAVSLMQLASRDTMAFSRAITSGQYPQFCQVAAGNPGEENIQSGQEVAPGHWVSDRGTTALGFVKRK